MANIVVITSPEDQQTVLEAIKGFNGEQVAVSNIAKKIGFTQSKVRYAIIDLIDAGKLKQVPVKKFNNYYIRYRYEIL